MSANLIFHRTAQHSFKDDLESLLYVLLWIIVKYSTVSIKDAVPHFMANVLDPQPYRGTGGLGKHDFLKGQSFLKEVKFPGREALHKLVSDLADLFRFRYELEPTAEDRKNYEELWKVMEKSNTHPSIVEALENNYRCAVYDRATRKLEGHAATIELFDTALRIRSNWPGEDAAQKQVFADTDSGLQRPNKPVLKTGQRTTQYRHLR
jgi:hypothetical protein